ncbi:hypothetical protein C8Q76DRAFT_575298, partial [Earliella scabrosa]
MPLRGPGAPTFDPDAHPRSILGFFDDLEYCFELAGVQSDLDKKRHALRYAPDSERSFWRSLPEFSDPSTSYADFKRTILAEYVGTDGRLLFTVEDLEDLVSSTAQAGFRTRKDLADYSRKFRDI